MQETPIAGKKGRIRKKRKDSCQFRECIYSLCGAGEERATNNGPRTRRLDTTGKREAHDHKPMRLAMGRSGGLGCKRDNGEGGGVNNRSGKYYLHLGIYPISPRATYHPKNCRCRSERRRVQRQRRTHTARRRSASAGTQQQQQHRDRTSDRAGGQHIRDKNTTTEAVQPPSNQRGKLIINSGYNAAAAFSSYLVASAALQTVCARCRFLSLLIATLSLSLSAPAVCAQRKMGARIVLGPCALSLSLSAEEAVIMAHIGALD